MFLKVMFRQAAFTLIEVIVTIVVIAIAATALLSVFTSLVSGSADPVIQQQATTVAEAYMEEIVLRAYSDPQLGETGSAEAGETRPVYDDVQDYNALPDTVVRDQNGTAIAALAAYSVTVTVTENNDLNGITALLINVTVTHSAISPILLSGYRAF